LVLSLGVLEVGDEVLEALDEFLKSLRWILEARVEGGVLGVIWKLEVGDDAFDDLLKLEEEMDVKRLGFLGARVCVEEKGDFGESFSLLMK